MAKLRPNKKYAAIKDNVVQSIFYGSSLPEYNEKQLNIVEIDETVVIGDALVNGKVKGSNTADNQFKTLLEEKKNEIKSKKAEAILEGVVKFKGFEFQTNSESYQSLTSGVAFAALHNELPKGFFWISKDNQQVKMTLEEFKEFSKIFSERVFQHYQHYENKRAELAKAKTVEDLKKIKW